MSEQFKVGDICIGQNFVEYIECNGMACEIVGGLEMRSWRDATNPWEKGEDLMYFVRWSNGDETFQPPHQLRKKHAPRSAKSIMREAILKAKQPCEVPA